MECQGERVLAVMLETRQVEILWRVDGSVVGLPVADEGKVQPRGALLLEDGNVGVVGQVFVDLVGEGGSEGMRSRKGEFADEAAVFGAGFEHLREACISASLEVQSQANVLRPGMLGHEG